MHWTVLQRPVELAAFIRHYPIGRLGEAENEILAQENFDDDLAKQEREESRSHDKVFVSVYASARAAFDTVAASGAQMPRGVAELIMLLQSSGAFWTLAKGLYDRVAKKPADDATIRRFHGECEPFRAIMVALFAAQYDRCIRSSKQSPSPKTGRNDTFMATCLPYCDQVITNDIGQMWCYREVVSVVGLDVAIRSYDEFCERLFVAGGTAASP
jgi:hypothetical protein